jgi:hypothetical protein
MSNTHRKVTPADEPVLSAGAIIALVEAIIVALTSFGVAITPEQHTAIIGLAGAVLAIAAAVLPLIAARRKVTPNSRVVEQEKDGVVIAGAGHDTIAEGETIRDVHDA